MSLEHDGMNAAPELPQVLLSRELGYAQLRGSYARGELLRVRRGAYRTDSSEATRWQARERALLARCVAVAAQLTCSYAFSHATAALLHGWPAPADDVVDITQGSHPSRCRGGDIRRHSTQAFRDGSLDVVEISGLPVTGPWQTVLDCVRTLAPRDAFILADAALTDLADMDKFRRTESERRQHEVRAQLQERLSASGASRGAVRARAVLEHADGFSGSPGESWVRWLALTAGLPVPVCEWEVWVEGRQYFTDVTWLANGPDWPRRALAFEYDGEGKYGNRPDVAVRTVLKEKQREDALRDAGVTIHRVMKSRLADSRRARAWMLSHAPASLVAARTPRPALLALP